MEKKNTTLLVHMPFDMKEKLKDLAHENKKNVSEFVRYLINSELEQQNEK